MSRRACFPTYTPHVAPDKLKRSAVGLIVFLRCRRADACLTHALRLWNAKVPTSGETSSPGWLFRTSPASCHDNASSFASTRLPCSRSALPETQCRDFPCANRRAQPESRRRTETVARRSLGPQDAQRVRSLRHHERRGSRRGSRRLQALAGTISGTNADSRTPKRCASALSKSVT